MKFGIIFCAYNEKNYVKPSLDAFIEAQKRHDIFITVSSIPFAEYEKTSFKDFEDGTVDIIKEYKSKGLINIAYFDPKYIYEYQARNLCLSHLLALKCDYVWIVDADELYTQEEIDRIISFVEFNNFIDFFKINFKNYIFDDKHWINETYFPRIFKTSSAGGLHCFYNDNDIKYNDGRVYTQLSEFKIPNNIAFVKHMSWTNDKGKRKVQYQLEHYGCCSYKWNEEKRTLEFNKQYYDNIRENLPIVNMDKL
jgi:glycosyltransferase involved in cell wall biosynthesis